VNVATKISILSAILVADLLFFIFSSIYYPEMLQLVLESLPWEDTLEKALLIIIGLVIAVISSSAIINILIKALKKAV
jgi:hypothetical protein